MRAKLCLVDGKATKNEIVLARFPLTIGRSRKAGLPIGHPLISREHCEIDQYQGALVVRDRGSSNGTFVNGKKIDEQILRPGDKLKIGPLTFVAQYEFKGKFPNLPPRTAPAEVPDDQSFSFLNESTEGDTVYDDPVVNAANKTGPSKTGPTNAAASRSVVDLSLEDLADDSASPGPSVSSPPARGKQQQQPAAQFPDLKLPNSKAPAGKPPAKQASKPPASQPQAPPPSAAEEDDEFFLPDTSDVPQDREQPSFDFTTEERPDADARLPEFDSRVDMDALVDDRDEFADIPGLRVRLHLADAGQIMIGTPVRVAGVEVGYVYNLTWTEVEGELRAEVLLIVQENLANVLKEDVKIELQEYQGAAAVVVRSPGNSRKLITPGQIVAPWPQTGAAPSTGPSGGPGTPTSAAEHTDAVPTERDSAYLGELEDQNLDFDAIFKDDDGPNKGSGSRPANASPAPKNAKPPVTNPRRPPGT